ncbi:MAG: hypothetical protein Q8L66_15285 [Caulobacter sp.]|nr:hypothetical protein [Caulobacter sp.]
MPSDQEAQEARRRASEAAHTLYFVPSYQGHWIGAVLSAATMVGGAMLYTFLPTARNLLGGGEPVGRTATTFLVLYAAMAVGPIGGWVLWALQRRWTALTVVGLFTLCAVWLGLAVVA